jgi:DNA-directed RNA polymerase subunit RPC12/RpoP
MKVTCPHCKKSIKAPDEWAGKRVKCPGCRAPVSIPDGSETDEDLEFDLGSLDAIEDEGEALVYERKEKPMTLKEAQAAAKTTDDDEPEAPADPKMRTCPQCGKQVRVDDLYTEVMCRHCGAGIPGPRMSNDKVEYKSAFQGKQLTTFYGGFTTAILYPIPSLDAIAAGMGVALGIIALPLAAIFGFLAALESNVAEEDKMDLGWVSVFVTVMFSGEALYFGSIAYYCLMDTIRSTSSGTDNPPKLTWSPGKLATAMGGYAALVGFYVVAVIILLLAWGVNIPPSAEELTVLAEPQSILVLALVTFSIPMNLIGLSSSETIDGLNPVKVGISIGRTLGHYTFLFLISLIYFGVYIGLMVGVLSWAGPAIMNAARKGIDSGLMPLLGGVVAWAAVMGLAFYFAYSIGRILGLFARTYREKLEFEL